MEGIYPNISTSLKKVSQNWGLPEKHLSKMEESHWKDVECAFGVLQAHFTIVSNLYWGYKQHSLEHIMKTCIILFVMILEYERGSKLDYSHAEIPVAWTALIKITFHG